MASIDSGHPGTVPEKRTSLLWRNRTLALGAYTYGPGMGRSVNLPTIVPTIGLQAVDVGACGGDRFEQITHEAEDTCRPRGRQLRNHPGGAKVPRLE